MLVLVTVLTCFFSQNAKIPHLCVTSEDVFGAKDASPGIWRDADWSSGRGKNHLNKLLGTESGEGEANAFHRALISDRVTCVSLGKKYH